MMGVVMLCSTVQTTERTGAARVSAGKIGWHLEEQCRRWQRVDFEGKLEHGINKPYTLPAHPIGILPAHLSALPNWSPLHTTYS
jgi:hypothetical protein